MKKTLHQHLAADGTPKRILSLDGGGIRGALTLGFLKKIETILQEKNGKDYLLCDHFDLIGGTSTGSIIAAALAIEKTWMKTWSKDFPKMLMHDASWQNQIVLQWLSNSPTAHSIDMEIDKLDRDYLAGKPMLKYLRYNFPITVEELNKLSLGKIYTEKDVESLVEMSNAGNREELYGIGEKAAIFYVADIHFEG